MKVVLLILALIASVRGSCDDEDYQIMFEDNFDTFDHNNWQHEISAWGGGNYEFQVYTNNEENTYVSNGRLYLKPTLTADTYGEYIFVNGSMSMFPFSFCSQDLNWGCFRETADVPPVMSAKLRSFQRFSFRFGRLEVDAKMPAGDWLWPAIWLLPEYQVFGGWPRSGEIDLVESRGNLDLLDAAGTPIGASRMSSTLHWGPAWDVNHWELTHGTHNCPLGYCSDHFHHYVFEWNEQQMLFFIDGMHIMSVPSDAQLAEGFPGFWEWGMEERGMGGHENPGWDAETIAPFDQEFHLILNVAVGGLNGYFPDNVTNAGGARPKPWSNSDTQRQAYANFWADRDNWYPTWQGEDAAMQINRIRVCQRHEPIPFKKNAETHQGIPDPESKPTDEQISPNMAHMAHPNPYGDRKTAGKN